MENNKFPQTIKRRQDFLELFKTGKRIKPCSWLILNYSNNSVGEIRFGWTVPKFVGNAVTRNKIKRWCREYVRARFSETNESIDFNIVFRKRDKEFYKNLQHLDLEKNLERGFKKIF